MKRPGVSEKQSADPEHEPDLYKVSEELAVPEKTDDESILLQCTLQGGPKARMPIYFGALSSTSEDATAKQPSVPYVSQQMDQQIAEMSQSQFMNFTMNYGTENKQDNSQQPQPQVSFKQPAFMSTPAPANMNINGFTPQQQQPASFQPQQQQPASFQPQQLPDNNNSELSIPNQLAMMPPGIVVANNVAAAYQASSAASQFAAGFAAATALSHQQFRSILEKAMGGTPVAPNQNGTVAPNQNGTVVPNQNGQQQPSIQQFSQQQQPMPPMPMMQQQQQQQQQNKFPSNN
jgi:hypothetical protein